MTCYYPDHLKLKTRILDFDMTQIPSKLDLEHSSHTRLLYTTNGHSRALSFCNILLNKR